MWKFLFGSVGAILGALAGLAFSVLVIFVCSSTVGEAKDPEAAVGICLGTVVVSVLVGASAGAYLGGKQGPPKS